MLGYEDLSNNLNFLDIRLEKYVHKFLLLLNLELVLNYCCFSLDSGIQKFGSVFGNVAHVKKLRIVALLLSHRKMCP